MLDKTSSKFYIFVFGALLRGETEMSSGLHKAEQRVVMRIFILYMETTTVDATMVSVIRKSNLLGYEINVYGSAEEPMFLAKDVALWIEHSNPSAMIGNVDDDEKGIRIAYTPGGKQEMWFLTEDGLYEVLMLSRKPIAKQFKKGVKEILKTIRKEGGYLVSKNGESEEDLMARALVVAKAALKRREERLRLQEKQITELTDAVNQMQPKMTYLDNILSSRDTMTVTQIAQDYGLSAKKFNKILEEYRVQRKVGGSWVVYAPYLAEGYVQSETFTFEYSDGTQGTRLITKWTQKGRMFLYQELKKRGILPLIEQPIN